MQNLTSLQSANLIGKWLSQFKHRGDQELVCSFYVFTWSGWPPRHRTSLFLLLASSPPPPPLLPLFLWTPPPSLGLLGAWLAFRVSNDWLCLSSIASFLLALPILRKPVPPCISDGALGLELRHLKFAIKGINSTMPIGGKSTILWKQLIGWMKCVLRKALDIVSFSSQWDSHVKAICQIRFRNCIIFALALYLLLLRPTHHFLIVDLRLETHFTICRLISVSRNAPSQDEQHRWKSRREFISTCWIKPKYWTQGVSFRTRAAFTVNCNLKVDQQSCRMSIRLHKPNFTPRRNAAILTL